MSVNIGGDLNARTGNANDYLIDDGVDFLPQMEWYDVSNFTIPRTSEDNIINNFGRSLLTLCQELDIHIVNGRVW